MSSAIPRTLLALRYERYAEEYLKSLPPEHFMEATVQATQREITLASLALVKPLRKDFHFFNELLVQYPRKGKKRPGQVVPDNMVVKSEELGEHPRTNYATELEPANPFWVLEYVSKSNERKDYQDNFVKYERELKVPYYLLFNPEAQEMTLFHHNGKKYVSVLPNAHSRCAIPELDIEVGLIDGWVRFWYQGELLPLPADLQRALGEANKRADQEKKRADELQAALRAVEEENARLRAQLGRQGEKKEP